MRESAFLKQLEEYENQGLVRPEAVALLKDNLQKKADSAFMKTASVFLYAAGILLAIFGAIQIATGNWQNLTDAQKIAVAAFPLPLTYALGAFALRGNAAHAWRHAAATANFAAVWTFVSVIANVTNIGIDYNIQRLVVIAATLPFAAALASDIALTAIAATAVTGGSITADGSMSLCITLAHMAVFAASGILLYKNYEPQNIISRLCACVFLCLMPFLALKTDSEILQQTQAMALAAAFAATAGLVGKRETSAVFTISAIAIAFVVLAGISEYNITGDMAKSSPLRAKTLNAADWISLALSLAYISYALALWCAYIKQGRVQLHTLAVALAFLAVLFAEFFGKNMGGTTLFVLFKTLIFILGLAVAANGFKTCSFAKLNSGLAIIAFFAFSTSCSFADRFFLRACILVFAGLAAIAANYIMIGRRK